MNRLSIFRQKSRFASPYFEQFILYDKELFTLDFARSVLRPAKQLRFFRIFSDKFSFFTSKTLVPNDPSSCVIGQQAVEPWTQAFSALILLDFELAEAGVSYNSKRPCYTVEQTSAAIAREL